MPRLGRDEQTDASRTGEGIPSREEWLYEAEPQAMTLADLKRLDPDHGETRGAADIGQIVPGK